MKFIFAVLMILVVSLVTSTRADPIPPPAGWSTTVTASFALTDGSYGNTETLTWDADAHAYVNVAGTLGLVPYLPPIETELTGAYLYGDELFNAGVYDAITFALSDDGATLTQNDGGKFASADDVRVK